MVCVGIDFFMFGAVVFLPFPSLRNCMVAFSEYNAQTLDRTGNLLSMLIERRRLREQQTESHLNYTASASIGVDSALCVGFKSSSLKVLILDFNQRSSEIGRQVGKQETHYVVAYFD